MAQLRGHDDFYGGLQFRRVLPGFTLAHRVADCPPEAVDIHTHLDAHFVLVTSGQYITSAQGTNEGLLPLVYNPPGTTHRDHFRDGVGSFFTVSVGTDRFEQRSMSKLSVGPASFLTDRRSRSFAKALLSESARSTPDCGLHLESLSLELLDSVPEEGQSSVLHGREGKGRRPHWLDRAYELLQDSYSRCVTVRELACEAEVHPVHLARVFRRCFGCTPGQLLQLRRLEKAADLLLFSETPLADIATDCGFSDQSHMTACFRRVYGMPPGQFRNAIGRRRRWLRPRVSFLQDRHAVL